jgi:endonuclease/exonuclease/phosphatase family metal-dependent hydrolase
MPEGDDSENEEGSHWKGRFSLLSYNIFERPPFIHNNSNDYKNERLEDFINELGHFDVICLQEMFWFGSRRWSWLASEARKRGFHVFSPPTPWSSLLRLRLVDSGLTILTRFPILKSHFIVFSVGSDVDRFVAKGACTVVLDLESSSRSNVFQPFSSPTTCSPLSPEKRTETDKDGKDDDEDTVRVPGISFAPEDHSTRVVVITTHIQASYAKDPPESMNRKVRMQQLHELKDFIVDMHRLYPRYSVMLCGDLNVNGRSSKHDGKDSEDYELMMNVLFDDLKRDMGCNVIDILRHIHDGMHPITSGDTVEEEEDSRVLSPRETQLTHIKEQTKMQRLDYIFLMEFPESTRLAVVSGRVEEFFIADRPYTQLSDHYGVVGVFQ